MNSRTLIVSFSLVAAMAFGCTQDNPVFVDPASNNPCTTGRLVIESFELANPHKVDILMVVDNSSGMRQVQDPLSDAMPAFVQSLNAIEGLDYHFGVVSTDIVNSDQQGRLQTGLGGQASCPGDRPLFVTRSTPSGATVAACNVVLGESGDDFEAGLEAVRYALLGPAAEPGGHNDGFHRREARLVVIVVSNEDDCSDGGGLDRSDPNNCVWDSADLIPLEPTYIGDEGFFTRIKGQAGEPVDVVTIVGPDEGDTFVRPEEPQPICAANGQAFSGRRYSEVVASMGSRGGLYSICSRGYENLLQTLLAEHIAPSPQSVCPFLTLTQEPVSVRRINNETVTPVPNDSTGYIYVGSDEICGQGRLIVAPDALGQSDDERLEVHYCTADPIPQ